MTRPPSSFLSGQDETGFAGISADSFNPIFNAKPTGNLHSSLYHLAHQKQPKKPKAPTVHKPGKVHVPAPKKPHVTHPPRPKAPPKPHVVHVAKPKAPPKPHVAKPKAPPKPHATHAAKAPKAPKPAKAGKTHLGKTGRRGGTIATGASRNQVNADGSITHLNRDGTVGAGHAQQSDGLPKMHGPSYVPGRAKGWGAATTIDSRGHRSSAAGAAAVAAQDSGHAATSSRHKGSGGSAHAPHAPHVPHAPHTPHAPKAHKAPKAPLQLNTDSFLGTDSHVESHRPTPLAPATMHRMPKPHYH